MRRHWTLNQDLAHHDSAVASSAQWAGRPGETEYKRPGMTLLPSQYYSIYSKSKHARQTALLVNYLVNSTEAGQLILTDRGLPSNPTVRSAIQSSLAPADQASAEFVDPHLEDKQPRDGAGAGQLVRAERHHLQHRQSGAVRQADAQRGRIGLAGPDEGLHGRQRADRKSVV